MKKLLLKGGTTTVNLRKKSPPIPKGGTNEYE